jgi:hypothetical protein
MWPFNKQFHYINGPVETTIPWFRPNQARFDAWLKDFLQIPVVENYDVWLCGGFLQQKWPTWDVDIVLTGPIDPVVLENILVQGLRLALNRRLLVDIQHQSEPPTTPISETDRKLITKTLISPVIVKNGVRITDWSRDPSLKQLGPHLWQVDKDVPDARQMARVRAGLTYDKQPLLIQKRKVKG